MRTLAHLSDLHFGREDAAVVAALLADLEALRPTLVVVSGDLTQRARRREFADARAFLERLPAPWLAVPGNHDIPLFDVVRRFVSPLGRYRRYVCREEDAFFQDDEIVALGLNTARPEQWKHGRVSARQVAILRARLGPLDGVFKVVVTHHPFVPPRRDPAPPVVGGASEALAAAADCGVDLLLAGHLHEGYTADVRDHHVSLRRSILVAQAGTATSHRRRYEPNAYNLITLAPEQVRFEVRMWEGASFAARAATVYMKQGEEWRRGA